MSMVKQFGLRKPPSSALRGCGRAGELVVARAHASLEGRARFAREWDNLRARPTAGRSPATIGIAPNHCSGGRPSTPGSPGHFELGDRAHGGDGQWPAGE